MSKRDVCTMLEYKREDGSWEPVGARAYQVSTVVRRMAHRWENVPPHYRRCRFCGAVEDVPS